MTAQSHLRKILQNSLQQHARTIVLHLVSIRRRLLNVSFLLCFETVASWRMSQKIQHYQCYTVYTGWQRLQHRCSFLHRTVKAGCILQGCKHFFSFLLDRACSCLRHKSSIQHCSFLLAHPLPHCLQRYFPKSDICFPIHIHKSASFAVGPIHIISPLHSPSMIPLLST